jgi:FdrA protein
MIESEIAGMSTSQRFIRGLFSGGTLCYEAMVILQETLGPVYSNTPLHSDFILRETDLSHGHTCIDLGSDEFTRGTPHPMISPDTRNRYIIREAMDPEVAVLLIDILLGYGSHVDMAGALFPAIRDAKEACRERGRYLSVVASVCGTEDDPQSLTNQVQTLKQAGVVVLPSNAQAVRFANLIAERLMER